MEHTLQVDCIWNNLDVVIFNVVESTVILLRGKASIVQCPCFHFLKTEFDF